MDSDNESQTGSSNGDEIEFVSNLGSEISELGFSDNEPDPPSPVPIVNNWNNDNDPVFSDEATDDEDVPCPDEKPPEWKSSHFRNFHIPLFKGPPEGPNLPDGFDVLQAKVIDYFQLFFTDELLSTIVQNMNSYALWSIQHKRILNPQYTDPQWSINGEDNITLPELKAFLG